MAAKKQESSPQSDFVSMMLAQAAKPREKTEPVITKEKPEEIEKLTKSLIKERVMKGL